MNAADAHLPVRLWSEAALRALLGAIWGIKAIGLENVPRTGALILACNHASLIDPVLLYAAIGPVRRPYGLAKKELFVNPLLGWFFRATGAIPVDRRGDATAALRAALEVLSKGACLAVFPEGTRVKPGERRPAKAGVSFLASRSRASVVPVRMVGSAEFPWAFPLEARFGKPMPPPETEDRETGYAYAQAVMDAVYAL